MEREASSTREHIGAAWAAIASAHPQATEAGFEILDAGGNAFDAAVAVSAALAVVEPYSSGIGGGGFWLLHRASDGFETMIDGDFLLLPVGPLVGTPLQPVTVEIDGREVLSVDLPLAFGSIEVAGYLPIYDLTDHQGIVVAVQGICQNGPPEVLW